MSFYPCRGGGNEKWPKFIKRIDSGNNVWEANDIFDVHGIKSVTVRYQCRSGIERIAYGKSDTVNDNFYSGGSEGVWNDQGYTPETNTTATFTINIPEKYTYLAISLRRSGKMIYEFISVT